MAPNRLLRLAKPGGMSYASVPQKYGEGIQPAGTWRAMAVQERSAVNIPPHLAGVQLYAKHNHNDDLSSDFGRGQWDSRSDRQGRR
jgi:hypothetical protein